MAMADYNNLPADVRNNIPQPTAEEVAKLPTEHKYLFPGRVLDVDPDHNSLLLVSASFHQGCCGAPVIVPSKPDQFIGVGMCFVGKEFNICSYYFSLWGQQQWKPQHCGKCCRSLL